MNRKQMCDTIEALDGEVKELEKRLDHCYFVSRQIDEEKREKCHIINALQEAVRRLDGLSKKGLQIPGWIVTEKTPAAEMKVDEDGIPY